MSFVKMPLFVTVFCAAMVMSMAGKLSFKQPVALLASGFLGGIYGKHSPQVLQMADA